MTSEHQTKAIVVVVGKRQNNKSYCYRGGEHQTVTIVVWWWSAKTIAPTPNKQQKLLFGVLPGQLLLSAIVFAHWRWKGIVRGRTKEEWDTLIFYYIRDVPNVLSAHQEHRDRCCSHERTRIYIASAQVKCPCYFNKDLDNDLTSSHCSSPPARPTARSSSILNHVVLPNVEGLVCEKLYRVNSSLAVLFITNSLHSRLTIALLHVNI